MSNTLSESVMKNGRATLTAKSEKNNQREREGCGGWGERSQTNTRLIVRLVVALGQGQVLQHNISAGVIVSNSSLVLQRVSRTAAGRYTCHAANGEGEGSSQAFNLHVLRKSQPLCPCSLLAHGTAPLECAPNWSGTNQGLLISLTPPLLSASGP